METSPPCKLLAGFGGDVDDSGGVEAELSRQAAVDQRHRLDHVGVHFLTEGVDRLGKQDAVHAVGGVGVLAADVFLAEGIRDDAGVSQ